MQTKRGAISTENLDLISAIWMFACNDQDTILTYKGVAYRLNKNVTEMKALVKSRAELFSTVVNARWLADWKHWVKAGKHYPAWVLELPGRNG